MTRSLQLVPRGGNYIRLKTPALGELGQPTLGGLDLTSINPLWWVAGVAIGTLLVGFVLRPHADRAAAKVRQYRHRSKRYGASSLLMWSAAAGAAGYFYGLYKGNQGGAL